MNDTVTQDLRTARQQAIDGLKALTALIELDDTIPVPQSIRIQHSTDVEQDVLDFAATHGTDVTAHYHDFGRRGLSSEIVVGKTGIHSITYCIHWMERPIGQSRADGSSWAAS